MAMENPSCPYCGAELRQTRRGATLAKRGPAYVCPIDEAEVRGGACGVRKKISEAHHPYLRSWTLEELVEPHPPSEAKRQRLQMPCVECGYLVLPGEQCPCCEYLSTPF